MAADDYEFGDSDFGDDFDFGLDDKPKTTRDRVKSFGRGIGEGLMMTASDGRAVEGLINKTMPRGYGAGYSIVHNTYGLGSELYDEAAKEVENIKSGAKSATRSAMPLLESFLPKKMAEGLKNWSKREESSGYSYSEQQQDDSDVAVMLESVFNAQQAQDDHRQEETGKREKARSVMSARFHSEQMDQLDAMRDSLNRIVKYQDNVTSGYQRKMLELTYRSLIVQSRWAQMAKDQGDFVRENMKNLITEIAKPDILKLRTHEETRNVYGAQADREAGSSFFGTRNISIERIRERLKENAKNQMSGVFNNIKSGLFNVGEMGSGLSDVGGMEGYEKMSGGLIGESIPAALAWRFGNKVRNRLNKNDNMRRTGNKLQFFTDNIMQQLGQTADADAEYDDSGFEKNFVGKRLANFIRNMSGNDKGSLNIERDSISNMQNPTPFTRHISKSITEVIPGYLSRILQSVESTRLHANAPAVQPLVYDLTSNSFKRDAIVGKAIVNELLDKDGRQRVRDDALDLIDRVDRDGTLSSEDREVLARKLLKDNYNNKLASKENLTSDKTFKDLDPEQAEKFKSLFEDYFKDDNFGEKQLAFSDRFRQLGQSIQNNRFSVQNYVNTGMGEYLEKAGIIKNGQIDSEKLLNLYMENTGNDSPSYNRYDASNYTDSPASGFGPDGPMGPFRPTGPSFMDPYKKRLDGFLDKGKKTGSDLLDRGQKEVEEAVKIARAALTKENVLEQIDNIIEKGQEIGKKAIDPQTYLDVIEEIKSIDPRTPDGREKLEEIKTRLMAQGATTYEEAASLVTKYGGEGAAAARSRLDRLAESMRENEHYQKLQKFGADIKDSDRYKRASKLAEDGVSQARSWSDRFSESSTGKKAKGLWNRASNYASSSYKEATGYVKGKNISNRVRDFASDLKMPSLSDIKIPSLSGMQMPNFGGFAGGMGASAQAMYSDLQDNRFPEITKGFRQLSEELGKKLDKIAGATQEQVDTTKDQIRKEEEQIRSGSYADIVSDREQEKAEQEEQETNGLRKAGGAGGMLASLAGLFGRKGGDSEDDDEDESGDTHIYGDMGGNEGDKKKDRKRRQPKKSWWKKGKGIESKWGRRRRIGGNIGKGIGRGIGGTARMGGRILAGGGRLAAQVALPGLLSSLGGGGVFGQILARAGMAAIPGLFGALSGVGSLVGGLTSIGVGAMASTAMGVIGTGLGALGTLALSPVGLAIGGVALAGYLGYKAFQWATAPKLTEMSSVRLVQYGFDRKDKDSMEKLFKLEKLIEPAVSIDNTGVPNIKHEAVDSQRLLEIFDTDVKDTNQVTQLATWLEERFLPIYLVHVGTMNVLKKTTDLLKVDDFKDSEKNAYLKAVRFESGPYRSVISPDPKIDRLPSSEAEVAAIFTELLEKYPEDKKDKEKTKPVAGAAAAAAGATAASVGTQAGDVNGGNVLGTDIEVNAATGTIAAAATVGTGGAVITASGALGKHAAITNNAVEAIDAIRFKLYGITDMKREKVVMLRAMESYCSKQLKYNADGDSEWSGNVVQMLQAFGPVFGVTDINGAMAGNWLEWFNFRFLPVFTKAMSFCNRAVKEQDINQALSRMTADQILNMANILAGTLTAPNGSTMSIWLAIASPWPDFKLNSDPSSISGNMALLEDAVREQVLGEKTKSISAPGDGSDTAAIVASTGQGQAASSLNNGSNSSSGSGGGSANPYQANASQGSVNSDGTASNAGDFNLQASDLTMGYESMGSTLEGSNLDTIANPTGDGSYSAFKDMLHDVAKATGVPEDLLIRTIAVESNFRAAIKNTSGSSAEGLGQFMPDTWTSMLERYGAKYGIAKNTPRSNPKANAIMTAEYLKENYKILKKEIGRAPNSVDLYLGHFLGATGSTRFLKAPPGDKAENYFSSKGKVQNASVIYNKDKTSRTVAELYELFRSRLADKLTANNIDINKMGQQVAAGGTQVGTNITADQAGDASSTGKYDLSNMSMQSVRTAQMQGGASPYGSSNINSAIGAPSGPAAPGAPSGAGSTQQYAGKSVDFDKLFDFDQDQANTNPLYQQAKAAKDAGEVLMLQRTKSRKSGTAGKLILPNGSEFYTLELAWRDNKNGISCIPAGTYKVEIRKSPKNGTVYELKNVPNRSGIQIHKGNWAGDKASGQKSNVEGCILLGLGVVSDNDILMVTDSGLAIKRFMTDMGERPFTIVITGEGEMSTEAPGQSFTPGAPTPLPPTGKIQQNAIQASGSSGYTRTMQDLNTEAGGGDVYSGYSPQAPVSHSPGTQFDQRSKDLAPIIDTSNDLLRQSLAVQTGMATSITDLLNITKTISEVLSKGRGVEGSPTVVPKTSKTNKEDLRLSKTTMPKATVSAKRMI